MNCVICNTQLKGKQRKFCCAKCKAKKSNAYQSDKIRIIKGEETHARRQELIEQHLANVIVLTEEQKRKVWYDLASYRQLFRIDK